MSYQTLWTLCMFTVVTSITPGPNNLMLLSSGISFGFRKTVPHMLGICVGFSSMVVAVGLGFGQIFVMYPFAYGVMKWVAIAYLLYLSYAIATSKTVHALQNERENVLGFGGAALFQWVNPKAWAVAMVAFSAYVPATASSVIVVGVAALFAVVAVPGLAIWTAFGSRLRRILQRPAQVRAFNIVMAFLLIVSLVPLVNAP
jgi:threonine/homoserine/homoserine lactone efflux protein